MDRFARVFSDTIRCAGRPQKPAPCKPPACQQQQWGEGGPPQRVSENCVFFNCMFGFLEVFLGLVLNRHMRVLHKIWVVHVCPKLTARLIRLNHPFWQRHIAMFVCYIPSHFVLVHPAPSFLQAGPSPALSVIRSTPSCVKGLSAACTSGASNHGSSRYPNWIPIGKWL